MTKIELDVPPDVEMKIARLVDAGDFATQERAIEELLSIGLQAYQTSGGDDDPDHELFEDDLMGHDDEYVF